MIETTVVLSVSPPQFKHFHHLKDWIDCNVRSARARLLEYEGRPKTGDALDNARNHKLAAAAEASLVQWGIYRDLVSQILAQEPRDPELFDGIDTQKSGEEEEKESPQETCQHGEEPEPGPAGGSPENSEPGQVQPDGPVGTPAVAGNSAADGQKPESGDDEGPGG